MKKQELAKKVAERAEFLSPREAGAAVEAIVEAVGAELAAGRAVHLRGFGTFSVTERKSRLGRNPRTGEAITIPVRGAVIFRAGAELKKAANSPHFGLDWLRYKDISEAMGDLRKNIEDRVRNPEKLGQEAKKALENAKTLYEDTSTRLKQATDSGGKAWGELKTGLENAFGELKKAWGKAKDSF